MKPRPGRSVVMLHLAACVCTSIVAGNCLTLGFNWFGTASAVLACVNASIVARRVW